METIEALCALPQPLIGAVNGVAYTGALELLLACDIIVAAAGRAAFCDTHSRLGLVPTWGLSVRLPQRIGLAQAKILSFTGRKIGAAEAATIGLVDLVVEDAELSAAVASLAAEMAANSADSIAKQKRMMDMGAATTVREALAWTDEVFGFHPGPGRDMQQRMAALFGAAAKPGKKKTKQTTNRGGGGGGKGGAPVPQTAAGAGAGCGGSGSLSRSQQRLGGVLRHIAAASSALDGGGGGGGSRLVELELHQMVDGVRTARRCLVHLPASAAAGQRSSPLPVLFVLHGNGGRPENLAQPGSPLAALVAGSECAVVCPEGLHHIWNLGREASMADDTAFLLSVAAELEARWPHELDHGRRCVLGFSNGEHCPWHCC